MQYLFRYRKYDYGTYREDKVLWCYSTDRQRGIVNRESLCLAFDPIMISASSPHARSHVHRVMSCVCCITMRQGRKRRRMEMSDRNAILPISLLSCNVCKRMRYSSRYISLEKTFHYTIFFEVLELDT